LKDFATAPDNPSKPSKKVVFADPQTVENVTFTQQEITAAINSIKWEWMPLSDAQVKFGAGNTVEVSGNLNMQHIDDFVKFIGGVGYSDADVNKAISWGEKMVGNAAVYVKGTASVANDNLTLDLQQVQVGRYSAPVDISNRVFQTGASNALTRADNLEAKSVTFTSDAMHFSGSYPKTVYVRQAPTN
jgi:hypothetical protein